MLPSSSQLRLGADTDILFPNRYYVSIFPNGKNIFILKFNYVKSYIEACNTLSIEQQPRMETIKTK